MEQEPSGALGIDGISALKLLEEALVFLDRCDAPGDIGASLDHVIWRLRSLVVRELAARHSDRPSAHS